MIEFLSANDYERHRDAIMAQFRTVHPQPWRYVETKLPNTHLTLVTLIDEVREIGLFRVLVKATREPVAQIKELLRDPQEISWLQQLEKDQPAVSQTGTALQICIVEVDQEGRAMDEALFTLSDGQFKLISKK